MVMLMCQLKLVIRLHTTIDSGNKSAVNENHIERMALDIGNNSSVEVTDSDIENRDVLFC